MLVVITSDNGPEMETWPDAAYTPFRCAKGSTWEGGVRVPAIVAWPSMIDPGQRSDGLFAFADFLPTALVARRRARAEPDGPLHRRRGPELVPPAPGSPSNRKHHYYWLGAMFSALRVGEYKFMLSSISDGDTDVLNPGGFTGVSQKYPYGRLYNLYLDPKETRSYLIRKLAYVEAFLGGIRSTPLDVREYPGKTTVGLNT